MERIIKWSKWVNPLSDDIDKELIDDDKYFENPEEYDILDEDADEDEDDDDDDVSFKHKNMQPAVLTQFGVLPIKMFNHPAKHFNFWVANTSFHITKSIKKNIVNTPGVEIFDVFSPYRFRIAIGQVFEERSVLNAINHALVTTPNVLEKAEKLPLINVDKDLQQRMDDAHKIIEENKSRFWLMLILPNGNLEYMHTNSMKDFENQKDMFIKLKNKANGVLITSDGQNQ